MFVRKRYVWLVFFLAIVAMSGASFWTKQSFVKAPTVASPDSFVTLVTYDAKKPKVTTLDDVERHSTMIIRARAVGLHQLVTGGRLTKVEVLEQYKGKKRPFYYVYEPMMYTQSTVSSFGGYMGMKYGETYMLFGQPRILAPGYAPGENEKFYFIPVSDTFAKFPLRTKWKPTTVPSTSGYFYRKIAHYDALFLTAADAERYGTMRQQVWERYQ